MLEYQIFFDYAPMLLIGFWLTIKIVVCSIALGIPLGLILALPNFLGNFIGAKLFDPEKTNQYRMFAYIIIAVAAISGLPVWD